MSSILVTLVVIAAAVALGIALAYLPMRLLLTHIANNVREFMQRQRDRRRIARETPDRRKPAV
jgi:hypothetical protein